MKCLDRFGEAQSQNGPRVSRVIVASCTLHNNTNQKGLVLPDVQQNDEEEEGIAPPFLDNDVVTQKGDEVFCKRKNACS